MTQEQLREFNEYMDELLADEKIQRMSQFIQHGDTTCLMHCKTVAYYSVVFVNKFHIKVDMKSLIRGALLRLSCLLRLYRRGLRSYLRRSLW